VDVPYLVAELTPVEKSLLNELQFGVSVAKFYGEAFFSVKLETFWNNSTSEIPAAASFNGMILQIFQIGSCETFD
jgi:hypothetical protein